MKIRIEFSSRFSGVGIWLTSHAYERTGIGIYLGFVFVEVQPKGK